MKLIRCSLIATLVFVGGITLPEQWGWTYAAHIIVCILAGYGAWELTS